MKQTRRDPSQIAADLRLCQFGECGCGKCHYKELKGDWCTEDNHPEFFDCDDKLKLDAAEAIESLQAVVPKLGKWVFDEDSGDYVCSECGKVADEHCFIEYDKKGVERFVTKHGKYCWNCGSIMEGE